MILGNHGRNTVSQKVWQGVLTAGEQLLVKSSRQQKFEEVKGEQAFGLLLSPALRFVIEGLERMSEDLKDVRIGSRP